MVYLTIVSYLDILLVKIMFMEWITLMILQTWLCSATKVYYVAPDGSDIASCPFHPCAKLDHYLLDNSSFSSVSDFRFLFLSGEHRVASNLKISGVHSFTLLGITDSNSHVATLKLDVDASISIFNSKSVILANLLIIKYGFYWKEDMVALNITFCISCEVKNVTFYNFNGFSMILVNMMGICHVQNIKVYIHYNIVNNQNPFCGQGIFVGYNDDNISLMLGSGVAAYPHNTIYLNDITVSGKRSNTTIFCPRCSLNSKTIFKISFEHTQYSVTIMLKQVTVRKIDDFCRAIMLVDACPITFHDNVLWLENCTFVKNILTYNYDVIGAAIKMSISNIHISVYFVNCHFISNFLHYHLSTLDIKSATLISITIINIMNYVQIVHEYNESEHSTVILDNSMFKWNKGQLLNISNMDHIEEDFLSAIIVTGNIAILNNMCFSCDLISIEGINTLFNGTISFTNNTAESSSIVVFDSCKMIFCNIVTFVTNACDRIITLKSQLAYEPMIVMEYANITIFENTCKQLILVEVDNDYRQQLPFCLFQYCTSVPVNFVPVSHFTVIIKNNVQLNQQLFVSTINSYTSHCKWLYFALYHGYHPGVINQQIIQFQSQSQLSHHTNICYCLHDNEYNCSVDALGPIFPGQKLQVGLLAPQTDVAILYVETQAHFLLNSTCKLVHQSELTSLIYGFCNMYNFTIASHSSNECELFLTKIQYNTHKYYDAFYVRLLACPIGFELLNGVCDCDPILSNSQLDIRNCCIDESTIQHPTNSWIVAHTQYQLNSTKYIFSKCPMDYCLPYSSHINLLYPDTQCQFRRSGILCSQCQDGLSMVFGSSRCMECTNKHIYITVIIIAAGIILVALLYFLNLTVTNGAISGIIFYANIISINDSAFLVNNNAYGLFRVFISFTNLDLGIETCFYNGMDNYVKMWLQLFFPLYLITIATFVIIASRYSYRIQRLTYTRSLPILATLFLLSYTSTLRAVSTVLFSYSTVTKLPSGEQELVWSIDASIHLHGVKFIILFITCLILFLLLIPFNVVLLFTRYLSWFKVVYRFKPLLDAFQGSYKYQYYYWIAVNILARNLFYILSVFTLELSLIVSALTLIVFTALNGYIQPNKNNLINLQELLLLVNLSILYTTAASHPYWSNAVMNVMFGLAFLQFWAIVLVHFFKYTCHCNIGIVLQSAKEKLMKTCCTKMHNRRQCDIKLLNIPKCTYNYKEYRDGLVSDDFQQ